VPSDRPQRVDGREAAVRHRDRAPVRQPARGLQQGLARPVGQPLVAPPPRPGGAPGGGEHGEERQAPDAAPGHRRRHHQAQPARAARLDEAAAAGAHRVAVDAARPDLGSPAALDGAVDADHHRAVGDEGGDEHEEQAVGHGPGRPAGGAGDATVDGETGRPLQAHDAQGGGDGTPSRRRQGAGDQDRHAAPDRGGEAGRERA
jgi:hypothetical protein